MVGGLPTQPMLKSFGPLTTHSPAHAPHLTGAKLQKNRRVPLFDAFFKDVLDHFQFVDFLGAHG